MGTVGLEPTCLAAHDPKSCASASFATSPHPIEGGPAKGGRDYTIAPWPIGGKGRVGRSTMSNTGRTRLWLERIGVALIAVVSLSAPFVFGFVYYLGVTDGIEVNSGDPLRESRVWMIQERRGPTGIGWQHTTPIASPRVGVQCAHTQLTVLNWRGGLSLDTSARYCRCFEAAGNDALRESTVTCE